MSNDFTIPQQQIIRQAISKWELAIHNPALLTVDLEVGKCPIEPAMDEVRGCIVPTNGTVMCEKIVAIGCTAGLQPNYANIQVDVNPDVSIALPHVVQHELGHLFGLYDLPGTNTVMYHTTLLVAKQPNGCQEVSPVDVYNYIHIHK